MASTSTLSCRPSQADVPTILRELAQVADSIARIKGEIAALGAEELRGERLPRTSAALAALEVRLSHFADSIGTAPRGGAAVLG